jgi:hypothetical protein
LVVAPNQTTDGAAVTVSGTGFLPGLGLLLEQCAVGADGDTSCLIAFGGDASDPNVRAGADGSFQGSLVVHRQLDAGGGVDCSQPRACVVLVMPYSYGDDIVTHANVTPAGVPIVVT